MGQQLFHRSDSFAVPRKVDIFAFDYDDFFIDRIKQIKKAELCAMTKQHDALVYVNEAHTRCNVRAGWCRADGPAGVSDQVDVLMGTFAKGCGVTGGYLVGADATLDTIRSFAPAFIFTLAMPPALAAAALTSVRHLRKSECERAQLRERTAQLKDLDLFRNTGIPMISEDSHIVSVQVGDPR